MSIWDKRGLRQNSLSASCQQVGEWKGRLPVGRLCVLGICYMTPPIIWGGSVCPRAIFSRFMSRRHCFIKSSPSGALQVRNFDLPALWCIRFSCAHGQWCLWFKALVPLATEQEGKGTQMAPPRSRDPFTPSLVWLWLGMKFTVILFRRTWSAFQGVNQYLFETFYGTLDACWSCQAWHAQRAFLSAGCEDGKLKARFHFSATRRRRRVKRLKETQTLSNPGLLWT